MPALPADIAAASRDVVVVGWSDAAIAARYPAARDGSVAPSTGYFDARADAQAVIDARGALIGTERRRFSVTVHELLWIDPTEVREMGLPTVRLIDPEQGVDAAFLIARIELDLDAETTSLELFG